MKHFIINVLQVTPSIELILTATDGGDPRLSNSTNITILVNDINEFSPVFSPSSYLEEVLSVAQPGTVM